MWKEFLRISLHDPIIWFAIVAGILMLFAWRAEGQRTRLLAEFAMARGFRFDRALDRTELRLSETDFFSWRDRIKNAVSGSVNGTRFTLFEQRARRGKYNSFTRTVVAFEADASAPFRQTNLSHDIFQMEKTSSHIFVWQAKRRVSLDELDPFLHSAMRSFQYAVS